jgi:hypothetical protein
MPDIVCAGAFSYFERRKKLKMFEYKVLRKIYGTMQGNKMKIY